MKTFNLQELYDKVGQLIKTVDNPKCIKVLVSTTDFNGGRRALNIEDINIESKPLTRCNDVLYIVTSNE